MSEKMKELMAALEKAETVEEINEIKANIEAEKEREAAIAEKAAMLASFKGKKEQNAGKVEQAKTLGEFAAKNLDLTALRNGQAKSAGTAFGFKAATDAHLSTPVEVVDQNVVDVARDLEIRALFGSEQISGTSLKYFVLGAAEGAPATVGENEQKPQFHIPYDPKTAQLEKVAGWYYETDELIEDNAFLRSSIDNRGLVELDDAIEKKLMTILRGTSGIQAVAEAPTADNIFGAMMNVKASSNYDADAIVINPADYKTLRLAKDGASQYYGGGYFYGPYGNDTVNKQPGLWGLNTVITNAVNPGEVIVGAFKRAASVITKVGDGVRVEVVTGDHEDRTNNRVTVIVEERLALAVRVPGAFVRIAAE